MSDMTGTCSDCREPCSRNAWRCKACHDARMWVRDRERKQTRADNLRMGRDMGEREFERRLFENSDP